MSAIGLSTAIGKEMFELIYEASPSALEIAAKDEVCPLSITAMKNDKDLFFRLLELGLDVSKASKFNFLSQFISFLFYFRCFLISHFQDVFAHCMMKSSLIPEISLLSKPLKDVESFWNDCLDNIEIYDESDNNNNTKIGNVKKWINLPKICIENVDKFFEHEGKNEISNHEGLFCDKENEYKSLISPTLTYNFEGAYPPSPKSIFIDEEKETNAEIEKEMNLISIPENDTISDFQSGDYPLQR